MIFLFETYKTKALQLLDAYSDKIHRYIEKDIVAYKIHVQHIRVKRTTDGISKNNGNFIFGIPRNQDFGIPSLTPNAYSNFVTPEKKLNR